METRNTGNLGEVLLVDVLFGGFGRIWVIVSHNYTGRNGEHRN